jgi:hypothetical protein
MRPAGPAEAGGRGMRSIPAPSTAPPILAAMSDDHGDAIWEAFVIAMLAAGPVAERRSRYGDKPALLSASREIAHLEAAGVIDLRITRAGWSQVKGSGHHPARKQRLGSRPHNERPGCPVLLRVSVHVG